MAKKTRKGRRLDAPLDDPIANLRALGQTEDWIQNIAGALTHGADDPARLAHALEAVQQAQAAMNRGILEAVLKSGESLYEYDVFISHSHTDLAAVEELADAFRAQGIAVYYDEADPTLDRSKVSRATALELQKRMRVCRALLLVLSQNSAGSGWVPWEVGFFDAQSGLVFILPLDKAARDAVRNQEWHQLYPELDRKTAVDDFVAKFRAALPHS